MQRKPKYLKLKKKKPKPASLIGDIGMRGSNPNSRYATNPDMQARSSLVFQRRKKSCRWDHCREEGVRRTKPTGAGS